MSRYHYQKPIHYSTYYGETYRCNHLLYDTCTLYKIGKLGLAVIQQRYKNKMTWWSEIDPWLTDSIYLNEYFYEYFMNNASVSNNGLYPTVTIRQIMYALKMKPLPKKPWETVFDRKII